MEQRYPNPYPVEYDGAEYRIHWSAMDGSGYKAEIRRRPWHTPWRTSKADMELGEFLDYVVHTRIPQIAARANQSLNSGEEEKPAADCFRAFALKEFYRIALTNAWCPDHNSTADQYRSKVENKLAPQFPDSLSIRNITWEHCEEALEQLEQAYQSKTLKGSFEKQRRNLAWILNAIFAYALSIGAIEQNPMEAVFQNPVSRLPYLAASVRRNRLERKSLSVQELQFIWAVIQSKHFGIGQLVGLALMLFTGVRTAEACALKYADMVELAPGEYSIRVIAQTRKGGKQVSNTLKTPAGYRMIPLIDPLAKLLLRRREVIESRTGVQDAAPLPIACRYEEVKNRCSPAELNACAKIILEERPTTAQLRTNMSEACAAIENEDKENRPDKEDREHTAYTLRKTALTLFNTAGGLGHMEAAYLMGHSLKPYVSSARWNVARDYAAPEKQRELLKKLNRIGLWLRQTPDMPKAASIQHGQRHYIVSPDKIHIELNQDSRLMVRAADPSASIRIRIRSMEREDVVVLVEPRRDEPDERDEISDCHLLRRNGQPFGSAPPEDVIEQAAQDEDAQPIRASGTATDAKHVGQKPGAGQTTDAKPAEMPVPEEIPEPPERKAPAGKRKADPKARHMAKDIRNAAAALDAKASRSMDSGEPDNSLLASDAGKRPSVPLSTMGEWLIVLTREGRIKRIHMRDADLIRFYSNPGVGMQCIGLDEKDAVLGFGIAHERDRVLLAGASGMIYTLQLEDIPIGNRRSAKGEWLKQIPTFPMHEDAGPAITAMMVLPAELADYAHARIESQYTLCIVLENGKLFRHELKAYRSLLEGRPGNYQFADTEEGNNPIAGMSIAVDAAYLLLQDTEGYLNLLATEINKPNKSSTRKLKGSTGKKLPPDAKCIGAIPHISGTAIAAVSTDGYILRLRFKEDQYGSAAKKRAGHRLGIITMKDLGAGANPPPETEQDKKDEPEVKEQGAGSEQNTAASGDMGEASDAQKAGNTNGAAASSEAEGNAEAQEQKADTSRSLAAVCDAGEDSVLIIVTSDGYCSFVKSSCYAVSKNNLKGRKLVKLHDGARVAAVQVAAEGKGNPDPPALHPTQ